MTDSEIPTKSAEGAEQPKSRARCISPRLRTLLIMVDGKRIATQLRLAGATIGAPADGLDQLLAQGLMALTAVAPRVPAAQPLAVTAVSEEPGPGGPRWWRNAMKRRRR